MRLVSRMTWWRPLGGLVVAAAALAKAEQPVQYAHGQEGRGAFGQVLVPESISEFSAAGPNGHFRCEPAKGQALLPVGEYRLESWTIKRRDDRGVSWTLSGDGFSEMGNFAVATNKPTVLEIGEPIIGALQATDLTNAVGFSLQLRGRLKETISFQAANQQVHGPPLMLRSLDGSFRATNTFEFG